MSDELADLEALRDERHHLDGRRLTTPEQVVAFSVDRRVLTHSAHSALANLAFAIAGRRFGGSWMATTWVYEIYDRGGDPTAAGFGWWPLALGKGAYVAPDLDLAVRALALDPARIAAAEAKLSAASAALLAKVRTEGHVRCDALGQPAAEVRKARKPLETNLLVEASEVHTATGAHTTLLAPFPGERPDLAPDAAADLLLAAFLHSSVVAPLKEAKRWFPGSALALERALADGTAVAVAGTHVRPA